MDELIKKVKKLHELFTELAKLLAAIGACGVEVAAIIALLF